MKWYVLRTAGGKEKKAKDYLEKEIERSGLQEQVSQVLVPVKKEIVIKSGKRKVVDKLLFPGYVLIQASCRGGFAASRPGSSRVAAATSSKPWVSGISARWTATM